MSNITNIKKSISNTLTAITGTVAVATEVTADATGLLANSVGATPAVMKALLQTPFSAAKGYLMEAEGLSEAEAQAVAFHYLEQDVATTIEQGGVGAGKLWASMLEDEQPTDDKTNTSK